MQRVTMLFVLLIFLAGCQSSMQLSIQHPRSGETFVTLSDIEAGDELTLSWIHSVEKTPWEEMYVIQDDGKLLLTESVIHSFGAGVPHDLGTMSVEDGKVYIRDINRFVGDLSWIHSHSADYTLMHNGKAVFQATDLPHHESVQLIIEKR